MTEKRSHTGHALHGGDGMVPKGSIGTNFRKLPRRPWGLPNLGCTQGAPATTQEYDTSLKNSKSAIKLLQAVLADAPIAKNRVFASESPKTHHARTTTHYWHHTDQCYSLGVHWWRLGSRLQLGSSRGGRNGPMTPPKRRSAAGTALDAVVGHFNGEGGT